MIGRKHSKSVEEEVERKGFDDFELRLGDVMRGERATMGKSLLDVQRELRIKAAYIAAIENCDPDAFDTPGFIAGYVRSYARYLGMNPDEAFETFCAESGFAVAHGMSSKASVVKKPGRDAVASRSLDGDIFNRPGTPFLPSREGFFSGIEPSAIGSSLVLLALIGAIGFGGYSVLQEVQRVQVAPVEQTPIVLSDLDPLDGVLAAAPDPTAPAAPGVTDQPRAEALDRLYRPQALDVPVLVARDAPISTIDPSSIGNFAHLPVEQEAAPQRLSLAAALDADVAAALEASPAPVPQVVEDVGPALRMVAVRPSWVRVSAADGTVIFETIMEPGETWDAPVSEAPPTLRTGESGAIYFALSGEYYGPVGETGTITSKLPLDVETLKARYTIADLAADEALATTVVELQTPAGPAAE
ncbi:helix-turn-helix domain-containing protein [uncultured Roseobacter sp.]|uniref:helix-turn-helix domain-containing protein n=1 Tax=uncultured Roseobacter sp. TaxID=114847 RepID=UPI00260C60CD|nr:helix-turn-helix domain-containing protein [uncultured Roseobacter sp.]